MVFGLKYIKRILFYLGWCVFLLGLAKYTYLELQFFNETNFVKWHAHFLIYPYLWLVGFFAIQLIGKEENYFNRLLALTSVIVALLCVEFFFVFTGVVNNYSEDRNGFYASSFNFQSNDSIRRRAPFLKYSFKSPEFNYPRNANSYGFGDREFVKDTGKIVVQTYGDSFTEGDGAPMDSTYPAILRGLIAKDSSKVVQNLGITGDDPAFNLVKYRAVGHEFKPAVIVIAYGAFDVTSDFFTRGGLERFDSIGWHTKKGPWWEVIYASSFVARFFFHVLDYRHENFFCTESSRVEIYKYLEEEWNKTFALIAEEAKKSNTRILLVKRPESIEIVKDRYMYDFSFFEQVWKSDTIFSHYDLKSYYMDSIGVSKENIDNYYWPLDRHHNSKGYSIMAQGIYVGLKTNYPEMFE